MRYSSVGGSGTVRVSGKFAQRERKDCQYVIETEGERRKKTVRASGRKGESEYKSVRVGERERARVGESERGSVRERVTVRNVGRGSKVSATVEEDLKN